MFDYNQEWTNERFQCEIFMFDQITLLNVSDSSSTEKSGSVDNSLHQECIPMLKA